MLEVLEHRVALLALLRQSLGEPSVFLRIGGENLGPSCARSASWAPTTGWPPQPRRGVRDRAGADGLPAVIVAVRQAASELSRFVAEVYDE